MKWSFFFIVVCCIALGSTYALADKALQQKGTSSCCEARQKDTLKIDTDTEPFIPMENIMGYN